MKKRINKIVFFTALVFIVLAVFSFTIGQVLPYEFADPNLMHNYYDTLMYMLPIAILFSLFGWIKKKNSKTKNLIIALASIAASILSVVILFSFIFQIGFGAWTTLTIDYRHKTENKTIKTQIYDVGALGYKGKRTVEVKPILKYWILPTPIDTLTMDKSKWVYVNEPGDAKFP